MYVCYSYKLAVSFLKPFFSLQFLFHSMYTILMYILFEIQCFINILFLFILFYSEGHKVLSFISVKPYYYHYLSVTSQHFSLQL